MQCFREKTVRFDEPRAEKATESSKLLVREQILTEHFGPSTGGLHHV